tara:strand:- start:286 stop:588 length:303 start_codon:yes stop_codon:yes gene_type:complete
MKQEKKYAGKSLFNIVNEEGFLLLGLALLIAHSGSKLLSSWIEDLIMPFVAQIFNELEWEDAYIKFGDIDLKWGQPLSDLIHFTIVILIAAQIYKWVRRN